MDKEIKFTDGQKKFLSLIKEGQSVALLGSAGTGKTTCLKEIWKFFPYEKIQMLSSTAVSALLLHNARTVHSYFGIIPGQPKNKILDKACKSKKIKDRLEKCQLLIIDEISMLDSSVLNLAEQIGRYHSKTDRPFGRQIILAGDMSQLGPISKKGEEKQWVFEHPVWEFLNLKTIYLTETVRTTESRFIKVLNDVRLGKDTPEYREFIKSRRILPPKDFPHTKLFGHRIKAEEYNLRKLKELPTPLHIFPTHYSVTEFGNPFSISELKNNCIIPEVLNLKEKAQVMMVRNRPDLGYVNGTLGIIHKLSDSECLVRLKDGRIVDVDIEEFNKLDGDGNIEATATNLPLILAYGTTIHKIQSATVDGVVADLSNLWEPGHLYVALSRVRSEQDLFIENYSPDSLRVDPKVIAFYNSMDPNFVPKKQKIYRIMK